jgi:hypothetical protein
LGLGRDIFAFGRFRSEFPEIYAEIERYKAEIMRLTTGRSDGKLGGPFEKARQDASKIKDTAQAKMLGFKVNSLMRRLGEGAFTDHKEQSGPVSFVSPIMECLNQIEAFDEEIRRQSAVGQGRFVTPRQIIYGITGTIVLVILLGMLSNSTHLVQDTTWPGRLPSALSGDAKFKAFQDVVKLYKQKPDEYASSDKRREFNERLKEAQQTFSNIPFDPTQDPYFPHVSDEYLRITAPTARTR